MPADSHRRLTGPPPARRPTVLVVDDEAPVRTIVLRMLALDPLILLWAGGGQEAIEVAERHLAPVDLLLTDLKMPRMDGRELANAMRARYPKLKVLFFSAYAGDLFGDGELLPMGIAYLPKPTTSPELREAVHALLAGRPRVLR